MRAPAAILSIFMSRYPRPLKKYDLEKASGLARETVRAWLPRMERYGWVQGRAAGKSKAGKRMVDFTLTKRGCFQASCLNPALQPRVRRLLGSEYREVEEAGAKATHRRMKMFFERSLPTITRAIETGTAPPCFYYCLELTTDRNGKVHLGKRTKVGYTP